MGSCCTSLQKKLALMMKRALTKRGWDVLAKSDSRSNQQVLETAQQHGDLYQLEGWKDFQQSESHVSITQNCDMP